MIEPTEFKMAPGATVGGQGNVVASAPPIFTEGTFYVPTGNLCIADGEATQGNPNDETLFVTVMVAMGSAGLHHPLTPEGARYLAKGLMRAADHVDGKIAAKASAAIERARKTGGAA